LKIIARRGSTVLAVVHRASVFRHCANLAIMKPDVNFVFAPPPVTRSVMRDGGLPAPATPPPTRPWLDSFGASIACYEWQKTDADGLRRELWIRVAR